MMRQLTLPTANDLHTDELRRLTNEMIDTIHGLIADCVDADVQFEPVDPAANDDAAASADEVTIAWTLGHVIVHATASSEEGAALGAELARGVEYHGRSRYETAWEGVTTIEACRARLEESRRMRLASLDMWPDQPHLDNTWTPPWDATNPVNAVGRFILGLRHENSHLDQIADVVQQARAARGLS